MTSARTTLTQASVPAYFRCHCQIHCGRIGLQTLNLAPARRSIDPQVLDDCGLVWGDVVNIRHTLLQGSR